MPSPYSTADPAGLFAAALSLVEEELDWEELGRLYCYEGGEAFFAGEQVAAIREAGLRIAGDVAGALEEAGEAGARVGGSLYFGAALAELPPALCEGLVLGREVRLLNLPGPEPTLLNGALARAEERLGAGRGGPSGRLLPRFETDERALQEARYDHVWFASVLTDPEVFPALHDELYDLRPRRGVGPPEGKEATGRGNLPAERRRARELVRRVLARLEPPGVLTTSDEELPLLRAALEERGLRVKDPGRGRLSAIVGDALRCYQVRG